LTRCAPESHVLVEKPMALDGASADRMWNEAARCGRVLMAAQVIRFWPEVRALRAARCGRRFFAASGPHHLGGWLRDAARSAGGLRSADSRRDFCLHLFGKPEAVSATGWDKCCAELFLWTARWRPSRAAGIRDPSHSR